MAPAEPGATAGAGELTVEVMGCAGPHDCTRTVLRLPIGSTVADALAAAGLAPPGPADAGSVGVWGHVRPPETLLRDRDRVELYRPLQVDPKVARRLRHQRQRGADGDACGPASQPASGRPDHPPTERASGTPRR